MHTIEQREFKTVVVFHSPSEVDPIDVVEFTTRKDAVIFCNFLNGGGPDLVLSEKGLEEAGIV